MKKILYNILLCTLLTACVKEGSDEFYPYINNPLNDTAWVAQPAANAPVQQIPAMLSPELSVDSFDVTNGATIKYPGNLEITFPPQSCSFSNGAAVNGRIKTEVLRLKTRGDLIRHAIPTTSYNRLLESGGAFFIKAVKEGQELVLAPGKAIMLRFTSPNPSLFMKVFYGEQNLSSAPGRNPAFNWVASADSIRTFQQRDSLGNPIHGYEMQARQLRWINCGYLIDSAQPRSTVHVLLSPNFTNANTSVYAVFKDQQIVVQLSPEMASRSFLAQNLPLNKNIILVSLSNIDGNLYLGTKEAMVTSGLVLSLNAEIRTKEQIIRYLETL